MNCIVISHAIDIESLRDMICIVISYSIDIESLRDILFPDRGNKYQ